MLTHIKWKKSHKSIFGLGIVRWRYLKPFFSVRGHWLGRSDKIPKKKNCCITWRKVIKTGLKRIIQFATLLDLVILRLTTREREIFKRQCQRSHLSAWAAEKKLIIVRAFARLIKLPNISFSSCCSSSTKSNFEIKGEIILFKWITKRRRSFRETRLCWKRKVATSHLRYNTKRPAPLS